MEVVLETLDAGNVHLVVEAIRKLMAPLPRVERRIGFHAPLDDANRKSSLHLAGRAEKIRVPQLRAPRK